MERKSITDIRMEIWERDNRRKIDGMQGLGERMADEPERHLLHLELSDEEVKAILDELSRRKRTLQYEIRRMEQYPDESQVRQQLKTERREKDIARIEYIESQISENAW